ncbi:hypothetical protein [Amycolatopsis sacchari]|uniref:Uncharacterized protein n=1 Tax=Amycolatopsis sacchari TaxID=115433 RepID=A0A1I3Z2C2_9PSEU|nr:hypothetical protein [Amycolatopsis sacchari]SFK38195.1 hypothetical protein SAMN05421835_119123 [Amycolatopsis sacchari]
MSETDATSLAEEVRLLVDMVVERAAPWLDGLVAAGHGQGDRPAGDCGWCPLCAVVAVVRGERPEFAARLVEHLGQLVALLRAVLADRWDPEHGFHMPGFSPEPPPKPENPRVQHIPVQWRGEES